MADFVLYKGKSLYTINEGTLINSFQELLGDIDTITYASYLCELVDIAMAEGEGNYELYQTLIKAFFIFKNKAADFDLIARYFEMKLLKATGYEINFDQCSICGSSITTSDHIRIDLSGGVCKTCSKESSIPISFAAYNILKFLSNTQIERVCRLTITREISDELYNVLLMIISNNYWRVPNSLKTYKLLIRRD
jgi:DNA repair protein RecO (recombination protein O)